MKKIISYLLISIFTFTNLFYFTINTVEANNCFIVTAYYSPLPNQNYYFKGSYEADIILNGRGTHGASGKAVFSGMFAGPKKYNFGTKIYLEGVGIGEIADRGGAIVQAGERGYEYDRIDIWMGHGEEGLKRALTWGKKTICNSYVMEDNAEVSLNIYNFSAPNNALNGLRKNNGSVFTKNIGINSNADDVKMLNDFLSNLGFYKGEVNSNYSKETVKAVYNFQKTNSIVSSTKNNGAGLWEEETRNMALKLELEKIKAQKTLNTKTENDPILGIFEKYIGPESKEEDIKNIQSIFKDMGIYKNEINGNYDSFKNDLITYQLKTGVIKDEANLGAGYFGPITRAQAKKDYLVIIEKKKIEEENKKLIENQIVKLKENVKNKVNNHIASIGDPKEGDVGENVRILQKTLKTLGYFKIKDSAIFGNQTKSSLVKYQIDKGIINTNKDIGAGIFGPKTKEILKNELVIILEKKALEEKKLLSYKK